MRIFLTFAIINLLKFVIFATDLQKSGIVASQLPSSSSLDEGTRTFFQSVSSFEAMKNSILTDAEGPQSSPALASTSDNSTAPTGSQCSSL